MQETLHWSNPKRRAAKEGGRRFVDEPILIAAERDIAAQGGDQQPHILPKTPLLQFCKPIGRNEH